MRHKARRGDLLNHPPMGYVRGPDGDYQLDPDEQAQRVVRLIFDVFEQQGSLHGLLRSLGVDEVIDYHNAGFEEKLKYIDVVLNTVDADTGARSIAVVRPGGILVSVARAAPATQCEAAKIRCAVTATATR